MTFRVQIFFYICYVDKNGNSPFANTSDSVRKTGSRKGQTQLFSCSDGNALVPTTAVSSRFDVKLSQKVWTSGAAQGKDIHRVPIKWRELSHQNGACLYSSMWSSVARYYRHDATRPSHLLVPFWSTTILRESFIYDDRASIIPFWNGHCDLSKAMDIILFLMVPWWMSDVSGRASGRRDQLQIWRSGSRPGPRSSGAVAPTQRRASCPCQTAVVSLLVPLHRTKKRSHTARAPHGA